MPQATSIESLVSALDEHPLDIEAAHHALQELSGDRTEWLAEFGRLSEALRERRGAKALWEILSEQLGHWAGDAEDPRLAARLWLQQADLLAGPLRARPRAVGALESSYRAYPDAAVLDRLRAWFKDAADAESMWAAIAQLAPDESQRALAFAELGHRAFDAGRIGDAAEKYRTALQLDTRCEAALHGQERVLAMAGAGAARIEALRAVAQTADSEAERARAWLRLGDALAEEGATREPQEGGGETAEGAWLEAAALTPTLATLERLAKMYGSEERWDDLAAALSLHSEEPADKATRLRALRELARLARQARVGGPEEEAAYLEAARAIEPWDSETLDGLEAVYRAREDWPRLVDVLEQIRTQSRGDDDGSQAMAELAQLRWKKLRDRAGAAPLYRKLRQLAAHQDEALDFFAEHHRAESQWAELYNVLLAQGDRVGESDPGEGVDRWRQAAALAEKELAPEQAASAWQRVWTAVPGDVEAGEHLPLHLAAAGQWHALVDFHRQASDLSRGSGAAADAVPHLEALIEIYDDSAKMPVEELAAETRRELLEVAPERWDALEALADHYERRGRWSELLELLEGRLESAGDGEAATRIHRRLGLLRWKRGQLEEALVSLRHAAAADPADLDVRHALTDSLRRAGDLLALYDLRQRALDDHLQAANDGEIDHRTRELLVELATLAERELNKPDDAIGHWEKLQSLDPTSAAANTALERLYQDKGATDKLVALAEKRLEVATHRSQRIEMLAQLAHLYADELGDAEASRAKLLELADLSPLHPLVRASFKGLKLGSQEWGELEQVYAERGDWRGYIRVLEDAYRKEAKEHLKVDLQLEIARIAEQKLDDPPRVVRALEKVFALDPTHVHVAERLVELYEARRDRARVVGPLEVLAAEHADRERRLDASLRLAELNRSREPQESFKWQSRAFLLEGESGRAGDIDGLIQSAQRADDVAGLVATFDAAAESLRDTPEGRLAVLWANAQVLRERLSRPDEARERLEQLIELDPSHRDSLSALHDMALAAADWPSLAKSLWRLVEVAPSAEDARSHLVQLGELYESLLDDPEQAILVFERMRSLDARDIEAFDGLSRILENLERHDDRIELITNELGRSESVERRAELSVQLAEVLAGPGKDPDRAVELLARALADEPDSRSALRLVERLFDGEPTRAAAARLLEPVYRRREAVERLLEVLEVRVDSEEDPSERRNLRSDLASRLEASSDGHERAFELWLELVREDPEDIDGWRGALRVATSPPRRQALTGAFAAATGVGERPESSIEAVGDDGARVELLRLQASWLADVMSRPREALTAVEELLGYLPSDAAVLRSAESLYAQLGEWELRLLVQSKLLDVVTSSEDRVRLYVDMADALENELGRPKDAAAVLEEALAEGAPRDTLARLRRLYTELEDWTALADVLLRLAAAAGDASKAAAIQLELAAVLRDRLGDSTGAVEALSASLRLESTEAASDALQSMILDAPPDDHAAVGDEESENALDRAIRALGEALNARGDRVGHAEFLQLLADDAERDANTRASLAWRASELWGQVDGEREAQWAAAVQSLSYAPSDEALERLYPLEPTPTEFLSLPDAVGSAEAGDRARWLSRIALSLAEGGAWPEATALWQVAVDSEPTQPRLAVLAQGYAETGNPEAELTAALAWIELAGVLEKEATEGAVAERRSWHDRAGRLARQLQRPGLAAEQWEHALEHSKERTDQVRLLELLDATYLEAADPANRAEALRRRAELATTDEEQIEWYLQAAATAEIELDNEELAREWLQTILRLAPGHREASERLEGLFEKRGQWTELADSLRARHAAAGDGASEAGVRAADLLWARLESPKDALEQMERILATEPGFEPAHETLREWMQASGDDGQRAAELLVEVAGASGSAEHALAALEALAARASTPEAAAGLWEEIATRADQVEENSVRAVSARASAWMAMPDDEARWTTAARVAEAHPQVLVDAVIDVATRTEDIDNRVSTLVRGARWATQQESESEFAAELWWTVLADRPADERALDALEEHYSEIGDFDRLADVLAHRAEQSEPEAKVLVLHRLASILQAHLGRDDDAAAAYEAIAEIDPTEADAYVNLAAIFERNERWEDLAGALVRLRDATSESAGRLSALRKLLDVQARRLDDPEAALETARAITEEMPGDESVYRALIELRSRGDLPASGAQLLLAVAEERRDWRLMHDVLRSLTDASEDAEERCRWLERAGDIAERRLGDLTRAFNDQLQLVALDPGDARIDRAERLAGSTGGWSELVDVVVDQARSADGDEAMRLDLRAAQLLLEQLSEPEAAGDILQRVAAEHPTRDEPISALERMASRTGRYEDLVDALEYAVTEALEPQRRVELDLRLIRVAGDKLEEPQRIADACARILEIEPDHVEAQQHLERAWIQLAAFDELESLYRNRLDRMTERAPKIETAFKLAFLLAEKRVRYGEAAELLEEVLRLDPTYRAAIRFLESLLERTADSDNEEFLAARRTIARLLDNAYDEETPWQSRLAVAQARMELAETDEEMSEALVSAGRVLRDHGEDPDSAYQRFATALRLSPTNEAILGQLEPLAEQTGAVAELSELYEEVGRQADPPAAELLLRSAEWALRAGVRTTDARELLELVLRQAEAEESDDRSVIDRALAGLQQLATTTGDRHALAEVLERRVQGEMAPDEHAHTWSQLGELRMDRGNVDGAIEAYEAALDDPAAGTDDDPVDPAFRVEICMRLEKLLEDQTEWEKLAERMEWRLNHVTEKSDRVDLLSRLASLHDRRLGRLEDAVLCYREIYDLNPNSLYAIAGLERLAPEVGAWSTLVDVMEKKRDLLADPGEQAAVDLQVAEIYHRHLEQPAQALDYYRMVLRRDEENRDALHGLRDLLQHEELRIPAALVLESTFEASENWQQLAELLQDLADGATDTADRAEALIRLAEVTSDRLGQPQMAIELLAEAIVEPELGESARGQLEELASRHDQWESLAHAAALTLDSDDPRSPRIAELQFWLAGILERHLGDRDAAIRRYTELIGAPGWEERSVAALQHVYQAEERWEDLYGLLAGQVDSASEAARLALRHELADLAIQRLDDPPTAMRWLREALADAPEDQDTQRRVERLAEEDPEMRPEAVAVLDPLYRQQGRWTPLVRLYELRMNSARDGEERALAARTISAILENEQGQPARALDYALQAFRDDPAPQLGDRGRLSTLADTLGRTEDYARALQLAADGTLDSQSSIGLLWESAGLWLDRLEDSERGEAALEAILALEPGYTDALDRLEGLYRDQKRHVDLNRIYALRARQSLSPDERSLLLRSMAETAIAQGEQDAAIDALTQLLEIVPTDARALAKLEGLHTERGEIDALLDVLGRQVSAASGRGESAVDLRLRMALLEEEEREDASAAMSLYEDVLAAEPNHPAALAGLQRLYIETDSWEQLRDVLERQLDAVTSDDARVDLYRQLAGICENELDEPDAALSALERVVALAPNDEGARDDLLRLLYKSERWEDFADQYWPKIDAAATDVDRWDHMVRLADVFASKLDDVDRAEDVLLEVLDENGDHPAALHTLATAKHRAGDGQGAADLLERLLPLASGPSQRHPILLLLGGIYLDSTGEVERAQKLFYEVAYADPDNREANDRLEVIHRRLGQWNALKDVLERQLNWATEGEVRARKARELAELHRQHLPDPERAQHWLQEAQKLAPRNLETLEQLARAYRDSGQSDEEAEARGEIIEQLVAASRASEVPEHAHRLGELRQAAGDADGALQAYRQAYQFDATYLPNLLALGRLLKDRGETKQALSIYQAMQLQQHTASEDVRLEIFHTLGAICAESGDSRRARQYFQRALRIRKDHGPTLEALNQLDA